MFLTHSLETFFKSGWGWGGNGLGKGEGEGESLRLQPRCGGQLQINKQRTAAVALTSYKNTSFTGALMAYNIIPGLNFTCTSVYFHREARKRELMMRKERSS